MTALVVISSPPFVNIEGSHAGRKYADPEKVAEDMARKYKDGTFHGHSASKEAILASLLRENEWTYGATPGNLGNMNARDITMINSNQAYTDDWQGCYEKGGKGGILLL